jgi:hypothetical protein
MDHEKRFDWLYLNNPYGPGQAWFVVDSQTGKEVGVASVFSRLMRIGGRSVLCGQVGDFAIQSDFRSLGPAILLQKATFTPVSQGDLKICYDTPPGDLGMATFKRMGMSATGRSVRFAYLCDIEPKIQKIFKNRAISKIVSKAGNFILATKCFKWQRPLGYKITLEETHFGDEYSDLDSKVCIHYNIYSQRKAEYLNWRYNNDPLKHYEVLTARYKNDLQAYCIFSMNDADAHIFDLFGKAEAMSELLYHLVKMMKKRKIATLHAIALEGSLPARILKKTGFFARENSHYLVAYTHQNSDLKTLLSNKDNWFINYSDIVI